MKVREIKPSLPVRARVRVPGSKSLTNRALICASLADGESTLRNASDSDDTALLSNGLNQLGVLVRKAGSDLVVHGTGGRLYAPKFPIPTGNAGTTLRFLLALSSLVKGKVVLEATPRMAERPNAELIDALRQLGAVATSQPRMSRFEIEGGSLNGGTATVKGAKSSQFLSSLLMVAPYAMTDVILNVEGGLSSHSYVGMTLDVMRHFGVEVEQKGMTNFTVKSGQRYVPSEFAIEPDATGASYFLAAAAITGGEVLVEGLTASAIQGEIGFLRVLESMGCSVVDEDSGIRVLGARGLHGVDVDMNAMPDVVPTLAVTALFASTPTRIRNVGHLKHKESDRLQTLATEISKLGARIQVVGDDLTIKPAPLHGAQLDTYDDHRLAMSFALAGLRLSGVKVENPDCVRKSFPAFWDEFKKLETPMQD